MLKIKTKPPLTPMKTTPPISAQSTVRKTNRKSLPTRINIPQKNNPYPQKQIPIKNK
jgi:hypothetical protein